MSESPIDRQVGELARILGQDPTAIKTQSADWVRFMQEGVIVQVHIGRWRGQAALDLNDLGLPFDGEHDSRLIDLGSKLLMPPEMAAKAQSMEVAARNFLRSRCVVTVWGFFLAVTAFEDVMAELRRRHDEYLAFGKETADQYETWKAELLAAYRTEARIAFRRSRAFASDGYYNVQTIAVEAEFIERYVEAVASRIPTADDIRSSFHFDIELSYIPLPALLAEDQAEAERIRTEAEAERQQRYAEMELARAEARKRQAQAYLDVDVVQQAVGERQRQLEAMNKAVVTEARDQKEKLLRQFMTDVVTELRQQTYEVVQQALATTAKNGSLQSRTIVSLRNWIETVRSLNFYNDAEIEAMIAPVQAQLDAGAKTRSVADFAQALEDVATVTKMSLLNLGVRPRRKDGGFDASPAPTPDLVRQSRTRLGLRELEPATFDMPTPTRRRLNVPEMSAVPAL